jgi:predicted dehydrogenase
MTTRTGVVGVGHMGVNHARVYAELASCHLSAVYDRSYEVAQRVAKYRLYAAHSLEEFARLVDAATVLPSLTMRLAYLLSKANILIQPIAETQRKRALSTLAASRSRVLVGHIERFNPVLAALEGKLKNPRFLEVTRLSPYPNRSTDIGVVLDLMIHDIEIILHIVRAPIVSMDPVGIAVLSKGEDIANVRFRFEGGCVANVTASRISRDTIRKIRVFQENAYLSLDYQKQDGVMYGLRDGLKGKEIVREKVEIQRGEPLKIELESFLECARAGAKPKVSGHEAADALDIALEITRRIEEADPRRKASHSSA